MRGDNRLPRVFDLLRSAASFDPVGRHIGNPNLVAETANLFQKLIELLMTPLSPPANLVQIRSAINM